MTDDARDVYRADDATLLNRARDGDAEAYEVLYQRHEQAAYRLARLLVPAEETDDLVVEAFDRILEAMLDGGGPTGVFRPYLLTALRRISSGWLGREHTDASAEPAQPHDLGEPLIEPAVADVAASPIAEAFQSLPDRWVTVLWHTEIEQTNPDEVSEILGLYPGEVETLCHRAWDGLRQASVQLQIEHGVRPECQPILRLLGAFIGHTASSPDRTLVSEHLIYCDSCDAACAELAGIDAATLRTVVAPVFLGSTAAAYLSAENAPAVRTATADEAHGQIGPPEWELDEPMPSGPRHASPQSRLASRPSLWIAGVTVAAGLVVLGLALTRPGNPSTSAHHQQNPQAALVPAPDGTGTPSPSPQNGATTDPATAQPPGSGTGPGGRGASGGSGSGPTASPTADPRPSTSAPSPTPSPTPSPSPTPTPTPSPTSTPTQAPGLSSAPTAAPSPTPSIAPAPAPSSTPTAAQLSVTVGVGLGLPLLPAMSR